MKNRIFTLFSLITSISLYAQEPDFAWVKRIGDNSSSNSQIFSPVVTVDSQGNSYMAGSSTQQTFMLDGITISATHVTGYTNGYGYIAKYNPNGQIIWAKSMTNILVTLNSTGSYSNYNKLLVDAQGNIYLCGMYSFNTYRFSAIDNYLLTDMTVPSTFSGSERNMFLAKLDADGNVLWVKKTVHPVYDLNGIGILTNEIHFDLEGHINMTGVFKDSIRFSPDNILTTNAGKVTVFLVKYSPEGEVLQVKNLVGETYSENQFGTEHVRVDDSGNLYRWSDRKNNNPKRLYRYDAAGDLFDSLTLDISTSAPLGYSPKLSAFTVSSSGDVFIGGYFFGSLTLEETTYNGFGNSNVADAVLLKLEAPNYEVSWVNTHLTVRSDGFQQLLTDGLGNVYAAGAYSNAQEAASVIHKYTNNGNLLWEKQLQGLSTPQTPTTGFVLASSLCQSQNGGNIWIGGQFSTNAYFSANDHFTTPANNHYNGFLAQYGICSTVTPVVNTPLTTVLCGQGSITLSANLNDPGFTYFWSTPTGTIAISGSETTAELLVTQPGKYYLVAQENAECYGKSQEIWVTQAPFPNNTITQQNNTLAATEIALGATYQWLDCDNNHGPIAGADAISFTPAQNGTYAVRITSPSGCTDTSACFIINNLSIDDIDVNQFISIYPNPATAEINIQSSLDIQAVRILDLQGKELIQTNEKKLFISNLSAGVYLIEIKTTKGTGTKKFLKE